MLINGFEAVGNGTLVEKKLISADDKAIEIQGKLLRIASIKGEAWIGPENLPDPTLLISELKAGKRKADIFTFTQRIPDLTPRFPYYMEWDNLAVANISTYDHWWTKQIKDKTRNLVRKAGKKGVTVSVADFDENLVKGIVGIYNETPMRQGRPFVHYGKNFETVKRENGTYLDRSVFLCAYFEDEVIGFIKIVFSTYTGAIMQILSKISHLDKSPTNLLISKTVELCADRKIPYIVYSKYSYGKIGSSSLLNFKRHNAFKRINIPRYYVPITLIGKVALKLKLHRGVIEIMPEKMVEKLRNLKFAWYSRKTK